MADDSYFDPTPTSPFDDELTLGQKLAQSVSPASAQSLVGPPPDVAPKTQPGQTTPQTGTLAVPPQQAVAKNLDTAAGRQSYNVQPAQSPIGAVQPARSSSVQPIHGATGSAQPVQAASMNPNPNASLRPGGNSGLMPALPANTGATSSGGLRTVVRDLNGNPAGSPLSTLLAGAGALTTRAGGAVQPAQLRPAAPAGVRPLPTLGLAAQQAQRMQAYNASPAPTQYAASQTPVGTDPRNPDPTASLRPGGSGILPASPNGLRPASSPLGAVPAAQPAQVNSPSQLDRDQARLAYLTNSGSGISQIKNPVGRAFARAGEFAETMIDPAAAAFTPGTGLNHQRLVGQQMGVVGNDEDQLQHAAQLQDTASQMNEREAQGRRADAQANYYNPEPLSAGQAQAMGHPEWEGLKLDARDAERLVGGSARNQTTLQTHFGGQQRNLSGDDAAAIGTPSLEGASMSNDEYQRLLQGAQRNQQWDTNNQRTTGQSDINNRRNNQTRITTTGMRDDTSEDNSNRAHPGDGVPKPIPAGVRDRIESQKQTALSKARASFDNGESSMDDYLDAWQQGQNDYEERIQAQTGQPVQHLDVRSNVDGKGNWIGNRSQPATAQPQAQPGRPSAFVTQKGSRVALGDPVKVGSRTGTVTGFNTRTGKAQVRWDGGH